MNIRLHRLLPLAIISTLSFAQSLIAQTMYDKSQYVDQVDVKISQPYTPFGNRPEFNRYGDDGSKCVLDANGVLTWIGNQGEVRLLPDSSKGVPLFVTNTECLVWVNRFVDYDNYPNRPNAQLRLYRSTPNSAAVTSQDVSFSGKEVIATPQVTTTTGALTFVSATRKDNGDETPVVGAASLNKSDDCELRFYRLTFDGGVQFIAAKTIQIESAPDFETNSVGPEIEAAGYGSDGSMVIKVPKARVQPSSTNPDYETMTYWIDNQGRFQRVVTDQSILNPPATDSNPCSRVLFVSNTRMTFEHSTAAGVTGVQEQRRSSSNGALLTASTKYLTASVTGTALDIWNYSQVGGNRYFYTVNTTDETPGAPDDTGTIIRTYKLNSTGVFLESTATLAGGLTISPATMTGTVNANDGSALLVTEDGDSLIWLHAAAPGYTALPNSSQASALFVDKDQAVIWENAKASVGGNGQIPNAIVKHYKQVGTVATTIRTDGNKTLLNTSRLTPDPAYWLFTTAIKTDASTSRLTTYKLGTVEIANVDTDGDGLLDYDELNPQAPTPVTNPAKADTDDDELMDGYELNESQTDPTMPDTDGDGLNDGLEILTHFTDPLAKDTDGDDLTDNEEVMGQATIDGKLVTFTPTKPIEADTDGDYFLDIEELKKGTNPTNNQSRPTPAPLVDNDGTFHDQPKLEENSPNTIKIAQQFSPFGNRSDYNRYGDDGSAMIVDVNGLLIWQDAAGKVREIPNSEQAAPLIVSNIESIVWMNAFADYETYNKKPVAQVVIYRTDPATGALTSTPVPLQGKEIVPTAPITSTTEAYSIVTSEHGLDLDGNIGFDSVFRLYRITFSGQVQRTGQIEVFGTGNADTASQYTKAIGHGSDGSIVFTQDGFDLDQDGRSWPNDSVIFGDNRDDFGGRFRRVFWVDGSRFNTSGLWIELADSTIDTNWIDPNNKAIGDLSTQISRVVYTSKTRVIYEKYRDKLPTLIEARRNSSTGALINDSNEVTPLEPIKRILQTSTQTVQGRDKYFYATSKDDASLLNVLKVTSSGISKVFSAKNNAIGELGESAFVEKLNPNDGSAVITSDDIEKLLWLHNKSTSDNKKNITELPGSRLGRTMFVDERELVLWANSNSPVMGNGRLEPVRIYHYEISPTEGTLINPSNSWTNLSYKIAGNFVMATPPFTPDTTPEPGYWVFSTIEKTGGTTAKVTRYRLLTGKTADDDGDRLSNAEELVPLDGRPFKSSITDPGDPDTDDDGISDGFEVHPFRIIDGDFSYEEARLDAINRGGRLAVIDSEVKLIQFKKQILSENAGRRLWLGGGDMEGGTPTETPNSKEGKYHWVNDSGNYFDQTGKRVAVFFDDKSGDFTNWSVGEPSNVGDLDGMQLEQDFTWSMAALTQRQGYVLEVNPTNPIFVDGPGDFDGDGISDRDEIALGTDPENPDTDGDGVSDYLEVAVLFTDPNGGSFGADASGAAVSFVDARGNYEGLLYNDEDGLGFKLALNVTSKGAFSGSLAGNFGSASLRGGFMADGVWSGTITRGNAGLLRMKLAEQAGGTHVVQGSLETPSGGTYYFQARRATNFPMKKLTSEASQVGDDVGPTGSALVIGSIGKGGKVTQQIYNPDGSRATYAGAVLEGNFMALYARTNSAAPTIMLGNVALRDNPAGKSNFDGFVRVFNSIYDQERSLSGAYYNPPTMGTLPLTEMPLTANNAVFSWSDGRFDGVNKVASWLPNKVTVPTTQNDKTTASYDRNTGLLKLTHTRTDATRSLINTQSNAFAVVVQGKDKLSGFYTGGGSHGAFAVQENSQGLQPEFTYISPLSKEVTTADSISYNVNVTATGDWTVDTTGATWITTSVKSGTGSGTVVVTVAANATNARREASIRIAGFKHTVKQSYR